MQQPRNNEEREIDFFVSYNNADQEWAKWTAWVIESAGYSVAIQAWDFRPGANFVIEMERAISTSRKTLIILSDNYINASYTQPEWTAAFANDPLGENRSLIPVKIEACRPAGLLRQHIYIDLVGITDKQEAREILLSGLRDTIDRENEPIFPGGYSTENQNREPESLHTLPIRDFSTFIGRKKELARLLFNISDSFRQHITVIDGIGGVGKTALVLEAANICLDSQRPNYSDSENQNENRINIPRFDAIVFTSLKSTSLYPHGIRRITQQETSLRDIYSTISNTLDNPSIIHAASENQKDLVYRCLSRQSTLLIIDNMDFLKDEVERDNVFDFLNNLPKTAQAIITTRNRVGFYSSISLPQLSQEESFQLIEQQALEKNITIRQSIKEKLYERFKGIPLALIYTIGRIASGRTTEAILESGINLPNDIARFCFEDSVRPIRGQCSHKLLMALSIFESYPTLEALSRVAGYSHDHIEVSEGLSQLHCLSLVNEVDGCYRILSLTREFARLEINHENDFRNAARDRQIDWYLSYTHEHGGLDWEDWRIKYNKLDKELSNIIGILEWCVAKNRYEDVKKIWDNIDNFVDLSGNWQIRISWLTWLNEQASNLAYRSTSIQLETKIAWTQMLMGGKELLNEAESTLKMAWRNRDHIEPLDRAEIAKNLAFFNILIFLGINQRNDTNENAYNIILNWLRHAEENLQEAALQEKEFIRYSICYSYYKARAFYLNERYEEANNTLVDILEKGKGIGWQRFTCYAEHRLGELALKTNRLPEARRYIEKALWVADKNREYRRIFLCKSLLARLEFREGNVQGAYILRDEADKICKTSHVLKSDRDDLSELKKLLN